MFILFPLAIDLAVQGMQASLPLSAVPTQAVRPMTQDGDGPQVPPLWISARVARSQPATHLGDVDAAAPTELWRNADGLFYVDGVINGAPVRFVVDTGASIIVLTADDARRAGVATDRVAPMVAADTAGGATTMQRVTLASMQIGSTGAASVPAAVAAGLQVSLLGQNWLSHIGSVTIEGDRLTLR